MSVQFEFELGQVLKDGVTGCTGVVMARAEYFTGCIHYALQSRKLDDKGTPLEWNWFDGSRLSATGQRVVLRKVDSPRKARSGPMPTGPDMN